MHRWLQSPLSEEKQDSPTMIEKKEVEEHQCWRQSVLVGCYLMLRRRMLNRLTVLVRTMHILIAGPRTRRLKAGNHGASGVEKPPEVRSQEVAPRRKVGSPDRQLPGGHASKVRCRSRCGAITTVLLLERQPQAKIEDSLGLRRQAGLWLSSLASRSLVLP